MKMLQKKPDKVTNNDSRIKQGKNNNYSPEPKKKTSRTKNGGKQFKPVVIKKI